MSALLAALNAIDDALGASPDESRLLIAAKVKGLLAGYDARWRDAGYRATAIEQLLESDLYNPETHRRSRTFRLAGKLDVIADYGGRRVLFDHKTTSQDIADPNSPYWRQLVVEGQVNHYYLLAWLNGQKFDYAVWDVVKKPGISPKKLSKAERASVVAEGRYFGGVVSNEERQQLAGGEERETLAMYTCRLAHDCTVERPDWYFQRRSVPRLDSEIFEYAGEVWDHGQDMLAARKKLPPRNSGACMLYGSPCKFLGICSGHDTPDSDKWRKKEQVHAELTIDGDGRDVVTNSRIRCFQTCRRKHYYEYELGIERQDEEEREALYFGSLWHAGLNCWWSHYFKESDHVNGQDGSSRNEREQPTAAIQS